MPQLQLPRPDPSVMRLVLEGGGLAVPHLIPPARGSYQVNQVYELVAEVYYDRTPQGHWSVLERCDAGKSDPDTIRVKLPAGTRFRIETFSRSEDKVGIWAVKARIITGAYSNHLVSINYVSLFLRNMEYGISRVALPSQFQVPYPDPSVMRLTLDSGNDIKPVK